MTTFKILDYFLDLECVSIYALHEKFDFIRNTNPSTLCTNTLQQRYRFLEEELRELEKAIEEKNTPAIIDALVDLVYVAKGTAVMMGIRWGKHFEAVDTANKQKERGFNPQRPTQKEDLIKPPGWKAPDHDKILRQTRESQGMS